jgi:hypothetical protein
MTKRLQGHVTALKLLEANRVRWSRHYLKGTKSRCPTPWISRKAQPGHQGLLFLPRSRIALSV